jgi:hypothetical protein
MLSKMSFRIRERHKFLAIKKCKISVNKYDYPSSTEIVCSVIVLIEYFIGIMSQTELIFVLTFSLSFTIRLA